MKNWKVYFVNWEYDLYDALKDNCWDYEAETEQEAWDWIKAHEGELTEYEEAYDVYHVE